MNEDLLKQWDTLERDVTACRRCPRLAAWREEVARTKRRAFMEEAYWGKPVPGFGDHQAHVMILGLAPGAHGSNRTGRMFTGDASGDFLYPALHRAGYASQSDSHRSDDGLELKDVFITAVCRCAPPGNKPTPQEQKNCAGYLQREINLLGDLRGIVALGSIAFNNAFHLLGKEFDIEGKRPKFTHGGFHAWPGCPVWLLASYHPSRQNTQTGRLTQDMFDAIWQHANHLLEGKR